LGGGGGGSCEHEDGTGHISVIPELRVNHDSAEWTSGEFLQIRAEAPTPGIDCRSVLSIFRIGTAAYPPSSRPPSPSVTRSLTHRHACHSPRIREHGIGWEGPVVDICRMLRPERISGCSLMRA
jgi:hypothetical protein